MDIVSVQYSVGSSWRAFVTDRDAAARSAIALLSAVITARDTDAALGRPAIYLYGQSLGALGADGAREWADAHHPGAVAGTLLVGVPADTVADTARSPRRVLANASDPISQWSTALLWRPAHHPRDTEIIGRPTHSAPWLPVISFLQTSVDLLGSLDGPAGTGHRYGAEQGRLPSGQPIGPRAAS